MQPTMRPVSSKMTFFYKRVFPVIWFGFLLLLFAFGLFSTSPDILFLIVLLLMAVFGYWFMKKVMFNLADGVLRATRWLYGAADRKNASRCPTSRTSIIRLTCTRRRSPCRCGGIPCSVTRSLSAHPSA